jgi:hypothetical protein
MSWLVGHTTEQLSTRLTRTTTTVCPALPELFSRDYSSGLFRRLLRRAVLATIETKVSDLRNCLGTPGVNERRDAIGADAHALSDDFAKKYHNIKYHNISQEPRLGTR